MSNETNTTEKREKQALSMRLRRHFTRNVLFYIIILAGLGYVAFLTFDFGRRGEELRTELEEEKQAVYLESQKVIDINNQQTLKMAMTTFVWAIRGEMLSEDYEQVNQYILQLIKEKQIVDIVIANTNGVIVHASNKKMEKTVFTDLFSEDYLEANDVKVEKQAGGQLHLIAPIMSFNNRIGTVVIVYQPETVKREKITLDE